MKLRLKDKDLPPVQLRLTLPGSLKASLDEYVAYLHAKLQRESDCKGSGGDAVVGQDKGFEVCRPFFTDSPPL